MVLEYANEGNLRDYLKNQFFTFNWNKKIEMALDITRGLMCLHTENIIHRNLVIFHHAIYYLIFFDQFILNIIFLFPKKSMLKIY